MATLEQILGWRNLTGVVQGIKAGIPNCLPDQFMTPGKGFSGKAAQYYRITGTRQTAKLVQYGAPSVRVGLRDIQEINVTCLHTFQNQQWDVSHTLALSNMGSLTHNPKAEEQASYQARNFKKQFANLRIAASLYCLLQGKIYLAPTANGMDLAPSSTTSGVSSATTIDYGIPTTNTGNCNGIISTTWDNATAQIITQLRQIQTAAIKLTGYPLEHAFYDDTVPGFIGRNAEAQQFLRNNPAMNAAYLNTGGVPQGFGGIANWHPAGSMFYDYNGTNIKIGNANGLVLTPAYDPEWFEMFQGSYPVPNSINPMQGADAVVALGNVTEAFGMFSYAQISHDPVTVVQYGGDTFLPVLKVPGSVYQLAVA